VNMNAGDQTGLTAHAEVLDIDGSLKWEKNVALDSHEDSTLAPIQMVFPAGLSRTHFIRLTLARGSTVISTNFYLHGANEEDYAGIRNLAAVKVEAKTRIVRHGAQWQITTELRNASSVPALMVRVKAVREKSGDPILPALYNDNYIALMPGERRTIHIELENADARGERPRVIVAGYNVAEPARP